MVRFRSRKEGGRRIVYPITPRIRALARRVHARRLKRARVIDESLKATLARDYGTWRGSVNRYDIRGVDTPGGRRIFRRLRAVVPRRPVTPRVEPKVERPAERAPILKPQVVSIKPKAPTVRWDFPHRRMNPLQYWWAKRKVAEAGIDPHEIDWDLTYGEVMGQLGELTGRTIPRSAIMMAGGEGIAYLRKKHIRLARLTNEEGKAWNDFFAYYVQDEGLSDTAASHKAWKDLQDTFPRLKNFDGALPDN